jgi:hypothetical protein
VSVRSRGWGVRPIDQARRARTAETRNIYRFFLWGGETFVK